MDKVSYALGLGIGQQLKSMGAQDLCIDDFAQAIKDVLENKELAVSHHEAQSIVTQYFQEKEYGQNPNNFLPRLCYFLGIIYWLVANKYRATLAYDFCKQKKKVEKKIKCKYLFSS